MECYRWIIFVCLLASLAKITLCVWALGTEISERGIISCKTEEIHLYNSNDASTGLPWASYIWGKRALGTVEYYLSALTRRLSDLHGLHL